MRAFLIVLSFLGLIYIYMYPGSAALFEGRTDTFLSDGTDPTTLPYANDSLLKVWQDHPSRFLYGAVYSEASDPEYGVALWIPWNERFLVVFHSLFFPLEQLSVAVIFTLFLLNALCMYLLCRYLVWSRNLSWGLSMAWAFCCYTRARAKVHGALVGTYHLPLIFLALLLVVRGRSKRSLAGAALAFFLAGTVAHYYLVTCIFLSPLFILFIVLQPEFAAGWKRILPRLVLAALPLLTMLGLDFKYPVPSDAKLSAANAMYEPTVAAGEEHPFSVFLNTYFARPLDYLAGDISLQNDGLELNPLRAIVNREILGDLGMGNAHERTNGIRWSILLLTLCGLYLWGRGRFADKPEAKRNLTFFCLFAVLTFWLSLSPDIPFTHGGASYFFFKIFPRIRVAARAAINVHFACLMMVGFSLNHVKAKWNRLLLLPGVFPLLMVADYPPVQPLPMATIYPAFKALQREQGPCGVGMVFPFVSAYGAVNIDYLYSQRLRGSDCASLNRMSNPKHLSWLLAQFPANNQFLGQLTSNPAIAANLERIARCVPLNWIVFVEGTPIPWAAEVCRNLGWRFETDLSCIAPDKNRTLLHYPEDCL